MKRQDGYYWCRVDEPQPWQIFEWSDGLDCFFEMMSDERIPESYFEEIGERVERGGMVLSRKELIVTVMALDELQSSCSRQRVTENKEAWALMEKLEKYFNKEV